MKPGERKRCEACGREMVGAVHPQTRKVAPILVETEPEDLPAEQGRGNVLLFVREGEVRYAVIGNANTRIALREMGVPLRLNHFADCPEAARFHRT
ncbi:MAG TPA: hypothetical protein VF192_01110 [Longimicrobiales bacterium]